MFPALASQHRQQVSCQKSRGKQGAISGQTSLRSAAREGSHCKSHRGLGLCPEPATPGVTARCIPPEQVAGPALWFPRQAAVCPLVPSTTLSSLLCSSGLDDVLLSLQTSSPTSDLIDVFNSSASLVASLRGDTYYFLPSGNTPSSHRNPVKT